MKKKLLFFITNLAHGGAERVLVNLANNLDKSKYDVTVMTIFDTGVNKQYLSDEITYRSIFPKTFHGIKFITAALSAKLLHRLFIKENYDIEVAYLEGPPAKIISGCPNTATKKAAWIHIELNTEKALTEGFRSKSDAVSAYRRFDRIVCVSETVKKKFKGISSIQDRTEVLYNTNETELIRSKSRQPVDDVVFHDTITICSVAKIEDSKGYDRLLEAHKQLLDDGFNHRVLIIGIGSQEETLRKQAKELGLENSFQLLGFRENPYRYMAAADLYVCSSRREGFSTAVTEALIVGTPVVSTDCSGARELLGENDEYGLVVENSEEGVYQGMKRMLSDPSLLAHYKEKAKERGAFFHKEKTVRAVEDMLDRL